MEQSCSDKLFYCIYRLIRYLNSIRYQFQNKTKNTELLAWNTLRQSLNEICSFDYDYDYEVQILWLY